MLRIVDSLEAAIDALSDGAGRGGVEVWVTAARSVTGYCCTCLVVASRASIIRWYNVPGGPKASFAVCNST